MKNYLVQYKPFLLFLLRFFLAFILLTVLYKMYLNSYKNNKMDSVSELVSNTSVSILRLVDKEAHFIKLESQSYNQLYYNQKYVVRIVEGCNSISVIILFISFVFAFSGKWKQTLLFIIIGSLIIFALNLVRIALLCHLLFYFPHLEHILHGVFFPVIIYGTVFILWIIWINNYSKYAKIQGKLK